MPARQSVHLLAPDVLPAAVVFSYCTFLLYPIEYRPSAVSAFWRPGHPHLVRLVRILFTVNLLVSSFRGWIESREYSRVVPSVVYSWAGSKAFRSPSMQS